MFTKLPAVPLRRSQAPCSYYGHRGVRSDSAEPGQTAKQNDTIMIAIHRLLPLKIPQPHQATKQAQNHEITCRNKTLSRGNKRAIVIRHAGRIIRGKLFSHKISARRLRPWHWSSVFNAPCVGIFFIHLRDRSKTCHAQFSLSYY